MHSTRTLHIAAVLLGVVAASMVVCAGSPTQAPTATSAFNCAITVTLDSGETVQYDISVLKREYVAHVHAACAIV